MGVRVGVAPAGHPVTRHLTLFNQKIFAEVSDLIGEFRDDCASRDVAIDRLKLELCRDQRTGQRVEDRCIGDGDRT